MPFQPVAITQLPQATLPLNGTEIVPLVKNGVTVQTPLSAAMSASFFGPEFAAALAVGNNNNVAVSGNRALFTTSGGTAAITGFNATGVSTGAPLIVTNNGANNIQFVPQSVLSLAANRIFFNTTLTILPGQSLLLVYSATLSRWVLLS